MLKIFEILLKGGQKVLKEQSGKTEKFESKKNSSKACDGIARANIEMRKSIDDMNNMEESCVSVLVVCQLKIKKTELQCTDQKNI